MGTYGKHVAAMVRCHGDRNFTSFYTVALQVAARESQAGHHLLAKDIKNAVDEAKKKAPIAQAFYLNRPQGELGGLTETTEPQVRLRSLIAAPEIHDEIRRIIGEQRQYNRLMQRGFHPSYRLLLEGPPGTGKTMTAKVLATELGLPLVTIRLDGLICKYLGETATKLRQVFDAVAQTRAVYFFDEFDALGADRSGNDVGEARRILNSFLLFIEETPTRSLILTATNHRSLLDRALFRRFDTVISYELPNARQAIALIRDRLGPMISGTSLAQLGQYTSGLSHADIVKAAEQAAKRVLLQNEEKVPRDVLVDALISRRKASLARASE